MTKETYTPGYGDAHVGLLESRSVDEDLPFLLPHLRAGLRVLDIGCGPGSLTIDLAKRVAPGRVTGVDVEPSQIERARDSARAARVRNVGFETGSAYELPFEDGTFDVVTAHTVLQHLSQPDDVLREVARVLAPGGLFAAAEEDMGGMLLWPEGEELLASMERYEQAWRSNGGDPRLPRKYRALMRGAGFRRVEISATCWTFADVEGAAAVSDVVVGILSGPGYTEPAMKLGFTQADEDADVLNRWRAWGADPDACMVLPVGRVLAWKA